MKKKYYATLLFEKNIMRLLIFYIFCQLYDRTTLLKPFDSHLCPSFIYLVNYSNHFQPLEFGLVTNKF